MTSDPRPDAPPPPPGVRTTRRRGRTSPAKEDALARLRERWMLPGTGPWSTAQISGAFGADGPLLVDVGVGNGVATRAWAEQHPGARVLAIELHRPGLAALLTALEQDGPDNVRVVEADAIAVIGALDPGSASEIRVLFPDPWPKRRHVARRLIDRDFTTSVAARLAPGGLLHIATDSADYAHHAATMVATCAELEADPPDGRPDRPVTTYEARGLRAGRTIVELRYRRR